MALNGRGEQRVAIEGRLRQDHSRGFESGGILGEVSKLSLVAWVLKEMPGSV
ncbi:hypothetical protein [Nocardia sp. NPDC004722]